MLFIEWFYNHPTLRYGGYTLLALLFFVPISVYLGKFKFILLHLKKKTFFIFFLIILVFISRNIIRIEKEFEQYGYNPANKAFFHLNKDGFILNDLVRKKYEFFKITDKKFLIINKQ